MDTASLYEILKTVTDKSSTLITWALSVFGGSILAVVSTSYIKPSTTLGKLSYLLFVIGWMFLFVSIYRGFTINNTLVSGQVAYLNNDTTTLFKVFEKVNLNLDCQISFFKYAIAAFSLWLTFFIFWFIFKFQNNEKK